MNEIIITGNVGADPELKMVKDTTLAEFSFAHTPYSKTKGEGETIWFKVTFWNSKADSVMDNIRKEKDGVQKSRIGITGNYWAPDPKTPKNAAPSVKSVHEIEEAPW